LAIQIQMVLFSTILLFMVVKSWLAKMLAKGILTIEQVGI